jgi:hypothetical protein
MSRTIESKQQTVKATAQPTKARFPQTKRFTEAGQTATGVFKGTREINGKFGKTQVHMIGTTEWYGSADLNRKLEQCKEGEEVTVKYEGNRDMENGRTIKNFTVTVND